MYFQAIIYDPSTQIESEFDDYPTFIAAIQETAVLLFEVGKHPDVENTYLWIKVMFAESEEDLIDKKSPYLRMNKLLCSEPSFESKTLFPSKNHEAHYLEKIYPGRHTGAFYITAIANLYLYDVETKEAAASASAVSNDKIIELDDEDISYPADVNFDCQLTAYNFMVAIDKLQEVLDHDGSLIKKESYKKALISVCFFIAEAARFNIVQFAAMNILNLYNVADPACSVDYQSWKSWKPIIQYWLEICEKLGSIRGHGLAPIHTLNIPVCTGIKRFSDHSFFGYSTKQGSTHREATRFVLSLLGNSDLDKLQSQVLSDFLINYPDEYYATDGIPAPETLGLRGNNPIEKACQAILNDQIELICKKAVALFAANDFLKVLECLQSAIDLFMAPLSKMDIKQLVSIHYKMSCTHLKLSHDLQTIESLSTALKYANCIYDEKHEMVVKIKSKFPLVTSDTASALRV